MFSVFSREKNSIVSSRQMYSIEPSRGLAMRYVGRILSKYGKPALCSLLLLPTLATAQAGQKAAAKKVSERRANEFTLAGLRPGRDTLTRATGLYNRADDSGASQNSQAFWTSKCGHERLILDYDKARTVQVIRVTGLAEQKSACSESPARSALHWRTGFGLRINDPTEKVLKLYGEPDSKSPSTRDGQPLELWYYAFDWAGPDVPQVMEVLCTRESAGQPGHVVEITLAAPSL
jgi:hypothetical protein